MQLMTEVTLKSVKRGRKGVSRSQKQEVCIQMRIPQHYQETKGGLGANLYFAILLDSLLRSYKSTGHVVVSFLLP